MLHVCRHRCLHLAAAFAVVVAILAGCDGDPDETSTLTPSSRHGPPKAATTVECSAHVEGEEPIGAASVDDLVVGPVRFAALRNTARTLVSSADRPRFVPIKAGVVVKAGAVVTVATPREERPYVRFGVPRHGADYGRPVRFEACPQREPAWNYDGSVGPWTGFVAGFQVRGPRCSPIEVWVSGRERPFRELVSFGPGSCRA